MFRERPDALRRLAAGPGALELVGALVPEAFDDPTLDLPPPIEADFVARLGDGGLLHVEIQGYRDTGFTERLFRYHLALVLRAPDRRVRTVAIWLLRPPASQRADCIEIGDVTVRARVIVLPEMSASWLLSDPDLACLAPAADLEGRTAGEVCALVARTLRVHGATWAQRHMATVAAAMHGRYPEMMQAMKDEGMEPIVIEDLVRFGEDRGYERGMREGVERGMREGVERGIREGVERGIREGVERGMREGVERGMREAMARALLDALAKRGVELDDERRGRILAEMDPERLRGWLHAVVAGRDVEKETGGEPIVIEDLLRSGRDRGYERGMRDGVERMREAMARVILDGLAERGVELDDARRGRILAETDLDRLREWLRALVSGRDAEI